MQHDGTLENCPFRGPLYIHANSPREQLLQNNHKHGPSQKDFNKNKYTSKNTGPPQATISQRSPIWWPLWPYSPYGTYPWKYSPYLYTIIEHGKQ